MYKLSNVLTNRPWVTSIGSALSGIPASKVDAINDDTTTSFFHRFLVSPKELAIATQLVAVELTDSLQPGGVAGTPNTVASITVDLRHWCGRALFSAGVHAVLGSSLDTGALYPAFLDYDASFGPLAAGAPPALFPRFRAARDKIIEALVAAYQSVTCSCGGAG